MIFVTFYFRINTKTIDTDPKIVSNFRRCPYSDLSLKVSLRTIFQQFPSAFFIGCSDDGSQAGDGKEVNII